MFLTPQVHTIFYSLVFTWYVYINTTTRIIRVWVLHNTIYMVPFLPGYVRIVMKTTNNLIINSIRRVTVKSLWGY